MNFNFGSTPQANPAAKTTSAGFSFGATATTPAGGFSFNATPGQTQATPTAGGFNLSAAAQQATSTTGTGGFNFSGTATNTAAATPAQTSANVGFSALGSLLTTTTTASTGLLGNLSTTKPVASTNATGGFQLGGTPSLGGGLGAAKTNTTTAAGLSTAGVTSGFTLGGGLAQSAAKVAATTTAATVGLAGGFLATPQTQPTTGLASLTQQSSAAKTAAVPAVTSSTAGFGLKLGGLTSAAPTVNTSSTGLSVGGTTATTTPVTNLTTATSTTASANASQSMNYRQLEEAINKWTLELEEQEKIFLQQATQVNAWDRLLIENGEKITNLNADVQRVKVDQQRLDQELDFILSQQKELEELLTPLEKAMEQLPAISYQQHADLEREHTYQLSENVDAQLKRMVQDLKEIIEHLNTTNSNQDNSDPMQKISKILNAHMDSLQWIDQNTVLLQRRVEEVAKQAEQRRKDQEKNFRLAYD